MEARVAAIILAAGRSSRMGAFKPLLQIAGATALDRCVNLFRDAEVDDIQVVTGHRREELVPLLGRMEVREVINDRYSDGMFSSVRAGVAGLEKKVDAVFILPVDIPLVRSSTVRRLIDEFSKGEGAIFYPTFCGRRGHPPLVTGKVIPEILEWSGCGGLKGLLGRWESKAREVAVPDEDILHDMDTPGDYRTLLGRAERLNVSPSACRG